MYLIPPSRRTVVAVLFAVTVPVAGAAEAQRVEGSFERTLTVSDRPDIDITSGSGSIDVREGAAGRIEIKGRVRAGDWGWLRGSASAEERVRRIESAPPVEQKGNSVRIGYITDDQLRNGISISYELVVPPGSSLRSKTGSGSQRVEGIGTVEASSGSGSIRVRRSGGNVRASTGSGSITAADVNGAFNASSGSGSIEGLDIQGAITARTSSGGIEVSQAGSGDVEASSSSGSVRVRGVKGGLRASTTSGSLEAEGQLARDWRLSSSSGHITIAVPASQGLELDATSGSGNIDVDFPVTVSGPTGRRALRGSARGGGPLLHIRTSSGGITVQ